MRKTFYPKREIVKKREVVPSTINIRMMASKIIGLVLREGGNLKSLLNQHQNKIIKENDRALLKEIVTGILRHLHTIDLAIDEALERKREDVQPELIDIIRVGTYQILYLSKIPVYAAVNECVRAAEAFGTGGKGFINGILRNIINSRGIVEDIIFRLPENEAFPIRYEMPEWLVHRYINKFGKSDALEILKRLSQKPPIYIVDLKGDSKSFAVLMKRLKLKAVKDNIFPDTYMVTSGTISEAALSNSTFYIMDPSSQIPAILLQLKGNEKILDLCSAPGGKSILLSKKLSHLGFIVGCDIHKKRLLIMKKNIDRTKMNINLVLCNSEKNPPFRNDWDVVILDAPCSSLGTLRRNPEIRWQISESRIQELSAKQLSFLTKASGLVKKGGMLLYSVCSIEEEETSEVIKAFMMENPSFKPSHISLNRQFKDLLTRFNQGSYYALPHKYDWNGFFISIMRKES